MGFHDLPILEVKIHARTVIVPQHTERTGPRAGRGLVDVESEKAAPLHIPRVEGEADGFEPPGTHGRWRDEFHTPFAQVAG